MDTTEYQRLANTFNAGKSVDLSLKHELLARNALGLVGEAGEVSDYIKKGVFHLHGVDPEKVKDELGDVMWYVSTLASVLDISLSDIMEHNINKLTKRYPNGFTPEDSINRKV